MSDCASSCAMYNVYDGGVVSLHKNCLLMMNLGTEIENQEEMKMRSEVSRDVSSSSCRFQSGKGPDKN